MYVCMFINGIDLSLLTIFVDTMEIEPYLCLTKTY